MTTGTELSASTIESWISVEQAKLGEIQDRIKPLREEERLASDRLARLKDLLSAYSAPGSDLATSNDGGPSDGTYAGSLADGTPIHIVPRPQSVMARVRGQVREVLADASEPMHILDIYSEFIRRGFEVPGAGKAANITAHLSGAEDIVSPSRGFYRLLAEDETPPAKKVAPKKTTTKKRTVKRRRTTGKK